MRARNAKLPDAFAIEQLIHVHVGDGTLLPRTLAEICENIRDFIVVENEGEIVGCGALHLYGMHLAEVRSITVTNKSKGRGAGRVLIDALMKEAQKQSVTCVCLFTRIPDFFKDGLPGSRERSSARQGAERLHQVPARERLRRDRDVPRHLAEACSRPPSAGRAKLRARRIAARLIRPSSRQHQARRMGVGANILKPPQANRRLVWGTRRISSQDLVTATRLGRSKHFVIPTVAKRSGGACCSVGSSRMSSPSVPS